MENLWPIALAIVFGVTIYTFHAHYVEEKRLDDARRMNALDAAISTSKESENSQIVRERAVVYQGFLEGKTDAPEPEPDAQPHHLYAHEAS